MDGFGELLELEIPHLRRYARALTHYSARADDLVQSCLLRALEKSHLWQPGIDLRAWLCTLLHNLYVNEVRHAILEGTKVAVDELNAVVRAPPRQTAALQIRDLDRAMARLPEKQRRVALPVGVEGMRYEEAARALGVPLGTVRSRLSHARDSLLELRIWRCKRKELLPITDAPGVAHSLALGAHVELGAVIPND